MADNSDLFSHTLKQDGTHESVCLACLGTIASHRDEATLAREEEEHVCKFAFFSKRFPSATTHESRQKYRTVHAGVW